MSTNEWETVELGDVTERAASWNPRKVPDATFTYLDLSAVGNLSKSIVSSSKILGKEAPSRARQLVQTGDILVSTVRPNLNAVAPVTTEYDGATASTGFTILRPTLRVAPSFLLHWVRSPWFIDDMARKATGASYPAVSDRIVRASLLPLPPLPEQRRIASILDEADVIRAKRRAQLAHLDELPQSLFHKMFDAESGTAQHVTLREVVPTIENGISAVCEARPAEGDEWGILKLGAVTYGDFRHEENKAFLGDAARMTRNEVHPGDVLMTRKNTRELVGAVAVAGSEVPARRLLPDLIFRLRLDASRVDASYFQTLMMDESTRTRVRNLSSGSAASMPNISKARLNTLKIPLPPLRDQQEFATKVDAIRVERDRVARALEADDELFAALQYRAFRAEL